MLSKFRKPGELKLYQECEDAGKKEHRDNKSIEKNTVTRYGDRGPNGKTIVKVIR